MTVEPLRVGIVCPYSFDVPGGVQFHVRDLAEALERRGHTVSVLAPADDDTPLPDYITSAGRAVPVRYNGSVARMTFGPMSARRAMSSTLRGMSPSRARTDPDPKVVVEPIGSRPRH